MTPRLCFQAVVLSILSLANIGWSAPDDHVLDDSFKYVTRPDIEAPRWNVTIYDKDRVSPGYWFVETYDYLDQSRSNGGLWNAPHIFDANGELIWSGAYLSQRYDSFDFRVSNVLGEDMLTWLYPRNRSVIILDSHFNVYEKFQASNPSTEIDNMHDLQFVDDGTRALYFYDHVRTLSEERSRKLGFQSGACRVREQSFRERDMKNDTVIFTWHASDHLDLGESTYEQATLDRQCQQFQGWDFMHANSLDKFPDDGSYLLSGRHTDAIYKIAPNGTIIWRLGGPKSDFEADFQFLRQHHARIHEHNDTHTIMSMFDNAKAEDIQNPIVEYSRGLMFVLSTSERPMKATLLAEYPHPRGPGSYTLGRGDTQLLPNGNIFQCWVDSCLQSEHTPDGKLIMEAQVKQEWLKSYRSYKFKFVGRPDRPPDVRSITKVEGGKAKTVVHASWNGATEVQAWHLFKTDQTGKHRKHLTSMRRTHFENKLEVNEYAKYIQIDAIDHKRRLLGRSKVMETLIPSDLPTQAVEDEEKWQEYQNNRISWSSKVKAAAENPIAVTVFWALCAGAVLVLVRLIWLATRKESRWWKRNSQSHELQDVRVEGEDESLVSHHENDKVHTP